MADGQKLLIGIVANPESGCDVRRLVSCASVFPTSEKMSMVVRVLAALGSLGVEGALKELVRRKAFEPFKKLVDAKHVRATILSVGKFSFVPLIAESLQYVAALHITLLGPSEPGAVLQQVAI